ncbi:peptidase S1 [Geobacillus thermocatenulatus]|uniref:Peptidase S1 n=2 Tax=Geobacillus TaxID=129337 RepID=A0A226Q5R6_9BACL|nr:trypsin-like peptidase domain-containing protein [Geobacillus thermocatenulatus]AST00681.1 peptidase S1 [Geobacillus thermocatenulatus]OXB87047.1 peptidase S1 [Geobacillus thermocatenulatus]
MDMMPFEPTPTPEPKRRGRFVSWLAASVAGAVIGSAATWYVAPKWMHGETNSQTKTAETTAKSEALPLQPTANVNTNMITAINKVADAVVGVVNIQKQVDFFSEQAQDTEAGTGSGVIFKKEGDAAYIVTNNHVIEGANKVEVALANGKKVKAQIVGADALTDLAVLKIPAEGVTKVASFGDSSKVEIGEPVAAIGNPLGLDLSRTVTEGIVSGKRTMPVSTSAGDWEIDVIQTDAAINPGNSGGALINSAGQVIGINSMKIAETGVEGLGFAIPSENVKPIVEQLMKDGKIKRPYLGVQLVDVADLSDDVRTNELKLPSNITSGAAITSVEPFSPAAEAGLKSKDVITAINGEKIDSVSALRKYLYTKTAVGDRINVTVYRDGFETTVSVTLKARDSSQS